VLAGHSLGAMSVVAWADEHDVSGRSSAIALINTGLGNLAAENVLVPVPGIARALNAVIPASGFLGARAPLPHFSTPLSHAATRYIAFGPTASAAQVAFFERMLLTCPPEVRGRVGLTLSELDLIDVLPKLDVPTLVIAGERDRLTPPSHARRIAELLPNLHKLLILPGTGHMAPLERAPDVSAALIELARTAAPEPTAADPTTSATV
jgi:pimeloyl-ACP methyl ester carboxylesterase